MGKGSWGYLLNHSNHPPVSSHIVGCLECVRSGDAKVNNLAVKVYSLEVFLRELVISKWGWHQKLVIIYADDVFSSF